LPALARALCHRHLGSWRADAALVFGLTSRDPNAGFAAGFTYVFNAFQIP